MQPLGEVVDEQVDHLELGQIGLANPRIPPTVAA